MAERGEGVGDEKLHLMIKSMRRPLLIKYQIETIYQIHQVDLPPPKLKCRPSLTLSTFDM